MENIEELNLVEDTTGANAPEIATTDENLSVDGMFQQGALPSLGRQIFSVVPLHGPTAALFNIRKKNSTDAGWVDEATSGNDFVLLRNDVEVYPSTSIKTSLTKEVIQDIRNQYGKESGAIIGKLLRGLANDQENTRTIAFLNAQCKDEGNLNLSDDTNSEVILFEVTKKVQELVLKANNKNLRTYEAFCVLPYFVGSAMSALSSYASPSTVEGQKDERGLFIAQNGQTKYYLNPDVTSTTCYVGLKDESNPSKSAAVFSPYISNVTEAVDPDSGEEVYHIFNRFAITQSPLHESGNEMMFKFEAVPTV